jgi:hypothetical protein
MITFRDIEKRLARIERKLDRLAYIIIKQGEAIMSKEADLLAAIQEETDAGTAVIALLDKVVDDLADIKAGMDPDSAAKLDEALAKVKANKEAWAAAVVRNTASENPEADHSAGM